MTAMKTFFDNMKSGKNALMGAALATMLSTGMAYAADGSKYAPPYVDTAPIVSMKVAESKVNRSDAIDLNILKARVSPIADTDRLLTLAVRNLGYALDRLDAQNVKQFGVRQTRESLTGSFAAFTSEHISLDQAKEAIEQAKEMGVLDTADEILENLEKRNKILVGMEEKLDDILVSFYSNDVSGLRKNIAALELGLIEGEKLASEEVMESVRKM